MALSPGTRLGVYEVAAKIGEGGMGEVYRARDTRLDRDVALKVLPEVFTSDPDRLARFEREATVLASLNHANIGHIYGLEEDPSTRSAGSGSTPSDVEGSTGSERAGVRALVLELIEGPTLADRIALGPIPIDEALPIAKQIAEALEAAHEQGVIHRDLKPANIKVRPDGTVKVLDFGLAKALDPSPVGDPSQSPTLTAAATQMGVIMGTAAYMSPEQASGATADKRSDIWSFGVVFFEMLAGRGVFTGDTVSYVLASVLKTDPDWTALPETTPAAVRRLLRRCLDRNSKRRLRDIGEARIAVEDAESAPSSAETVAAVASTRLQLWQRPVPAAVGLLAAMAIPAAVVWGLTRPGPAIPGEVTHFSVPVDTGHELYLGECPRLALSPDGRTLAYVAAEQLYLRRMDSLDSVALEGTAGAESPFFSPDGRMLGFVQGSDFKIRPVDGGPTTEIPGAGSSGYACSGASWSPDGTIAFRPSGSRVLFSVPAAGGEPQPLTTIRDPDIESFHMWPQVIDGGRRLLFTLLGPSGVWADSRLVIEDLATGERTTAVEQATYGRYVPSGHIVYATASGTVFAVPFDLASGGTTGDRFPVASGVRVAAWGGGASFAVSDARTAAFVHGSVLTRQQLWWVDRQGQRVGQIGSPLSTFYLDLSPDGERVATDIEQPTNGDVWLIDTTTGRRERLTFNPGFDQSPVWSPDGQRVAYVTFPTGAAVIEVQDVDGRGQAVTVHAPEALTDLYLWSWSPDGWLAYFLSGDGDNNLYAVHVDDPEQVIDVAVSGANESFPHFSPDGRWLAYDSDETGRTEVYVMPFPEVGRPEQVSTEGGEHPRWSAAGDELFFWRGTTLMVSEISTGETLSTTVPRPLFDAPDLTGDMAYDVGPDGQLFLLALKNPDSPAREIHVVENWQWQLEERIPVP